MIKAISFVVLNWCHDETALPAPPTGMRASRRTFRGHKGTQKIGDCSLPAPKNTDSRPRCRPTGTNTPLRVPLALLAQRHSQLLPAPVPTLDSYHELYNPKLEFYNPKFGFHNSSHESQLAASMGMRLLWGPCGRCRGSGSEARLPPCNKVVRHGEEEAGGGKGKSRLSDKIPAKILFCQ